jgi:hypothetical protein
MCRPLLAHLAAASRADRGAKNETCLPRSTSDVDHTEGIALITPISEEGCFAVVQRRRSERIREQGARCASGHLLASTRVSAKYERVLQENTSVAKGPLAHCADYHVVAEGDGAGRSEATDQSAGGIPLRCGRAPAICSHAPKANPRRAGGRSSSGGGASCSGLNLSASSGRFRRSKRACGPP